jgi:hypothetical protein
MLHALNHAQTGPAFARLLAEPLAEAQLPAALELLDKSGARLTATAAAESHYAAGMAALDEALGVEASTSTLAAVAGWLLQRNQ